MRGDRIFFGALALVSVLPLAGPWLTSPTLLIIPAAANMIGFAHVGSTAFLYVDDELRPVARRYFWHFTGALLVVPLGCLALSLIAPTIAGLGVVAFIAWNLHHFQRQNYGLIALAAASTGFGKLPVRLNRMMNLVSLAACIALLALPGAEPGFKFAMRTGGTLIYILAGLEFILLLQSEPRLIANRRVLFFTILGFVFYLPALLLGDMLAAFWSYGLAHAAQYLVMGGVFSAGSTRRLAGFATWLVLGLFGFAFLMVVRADALFWPFWIGLTICHFLVDARAWRLREEPQRSIVRRRFSFLFAPAAPVTASLQTV
jgi:hypothetical protein